MNTAGSLSIILPIVERITRVPGKLLALLSAGTSVLVILVGGFAGYYGSGGTKWLPLTVGLISLVVAAVFWVRRARLEKFVDQTIAMHGRNIFDSVSAKITDGSTEPGEVIEVTESGVVESSSAEKDSKTDWQQRRQDAQAEASAKRDTFFPRLEAAQRAAIAAVGGVQNAPYLTDDLRWTVVSAIATAVTPVVNLLFFVVGLVIWL
ncbi:MAG: hypothetical protein Q4E03_05140 [Trueperella sp.]|nr:hypothetical protein [Trueperella sp.]